jgi:hypothetical protein
VRVAQLAVLDLELAGGVGLELFDVGLAGSVSVGLGVSACCVRNWQWYWGTRGPGDPGPRGAYLSKTMMAVMEDGRGFVFKD